MSQLSQINSNLWLGDYAHVDAAVAAGCTAIVNVAASLNYTAPLGTDYNKVGLVDGGTDACPQYEAVIDTINGLIAQGEVVFVHCVQGINRGPAMVALYYHEYYDYSWDSAVAFVEARHSDSATWPALQATLEECFPDETSTSTCPSVECCDQSPLQYDPVSRTVYENEEQTGTAECPEGYTGASQTVTIAAGTAAYDSYISVADANAKAYAAALAQAAALLTCVDENVDPALYWNTEQTAYCPEGQTGEPVTIAAHTPPYSSSVSQAAADALALAAATAALECGLAGQLSGLMWRIPCGNNGEDETCPCVSPGDQYVTITGAVGVTYNVTIRIRGIVETKDYLGGSQLITPDEQSDTYVVKDSTYNLADGYNVYALSVSNPSAIYYLNSSTTHPCASSSPYILDYTVIIPMTTGATIGLLADVRDANQMTNRTNLESDNSPAIDIVQPYNGQFLEMSVVSIVEA